MRFFNTLLAAGAFAIASGQSSTGTSAGTTTTPGVDPAQSSAQAEMIKCIEACQPGDVACTSKCIAVPNPSGAQINETNNCVAACPQGNGTAADIQNYQNCKEGCIGQYYYTTGGTPLATGGSNSNGSPSGTGTNTGSGSSATGSLSGTGTGAAASTSTSKAAADIVHVAGSAAGLLGFVAAILAL